MAAWRTFISLVLLLLSYTGLSGMAITASRNGLFEELRGQRKDTTGHSMNPQGSVLAIPVKVCQSMVRFFMPIVSLEDFGIGLQGIRFISIWMSTWLLMDLESLSGNQDDPSKKFLPLFGVLMEFLGVGTVLPLWCLTNIWFSHADAMPLRTAKPIAHPHDISVMGWSLLIGAGIPTTFMYCSSPGASNPLFSKELWIVVRLFHPVISWMTYRVLRGGAAISDGSISTAELVLSDQKLHQLQNIAYWICALAHATSFVAAILASIRTSRSSARNKPASPWPPIVSPWRAWPSRVKSVKEGIGIFLFWDEAVTSAAILLWAPAVNRIALTQQAWGQTVHIVGKTLIHLLVAGPTAAAAILIQDKGTIASS